MPEGFWYDFNKFVILRVFMFIQGSTFKKWLYQSYEILVNESRVMVQPQHISRIYTMLKNDQTVWNQFYFSSNICNLLALKRPKNINKKLNEKFLNLLTDNIFHVNLIQKKNMWDGMYSIFPVNMSSILNKNWVLFRDFHLFYWENLILFTGECCKLLFH